jgi:general stress protein 26
LRPSVVAKNSKYEERKMIQKIKKKIGKKLLTNYKQRIQKAFDPSLTHCLKTIRVLLKKSRYCFLITHSNRQWPSARMVQPVIDDDSLDIWIGTNPNLRKIKEIKNNPHITLTFGLDRYHANLIIYGTATIVADQAERKKHWLNSWMMFFPGGPESKDFVSLKIEPVEIELMSFKHHIVDEPFGLKPLRILKKNEGWQVGL